jgi:phage terminase large subunit-like protein
MNRCKLDPRIEEYAQLVESDKPKCNKEQHALIKHVRACFENEDIYTDSAALDNYLRLEKYFPFELFPWERFIFALWNCTFYGGTKKPRWKTLFCMIGRGAGKDGYIAFDSCAMVSPYNDVPHYNVDICANNEEQAQQPLMDFIETLRTPAYEAKLKKYFYHTKEIAQGRRNLGVIKGRTNNPKGRDGMRSGKVVFNEVHRFENYANIKVFITGLGKVAQSRVGYFTSNGDVSDGPLDDLDARSQRILFEGEDDKGFLPFIYRLNNKKQVHDESNWYMANPSLAYRPDLLDEIRDEYEEWKEHPEQNGDFLTKRMGIRSSNREIAVTEYENVKATNKPLPENMRGWSCTVGIDYANINDFAAVNFHFKNGDERFDINKAWFCLESKDKPRLKIPWEDWAENGKLTLVDDVNISPTLLTDYIRELGKIYNIKKIALDNYRYALLAEALADIGFDAKNRKNVKLIRPSDIMAVDGVIQDCFTRHLFTWGDDVALRWAVNNAKRVCSSRKIGSDTGNYYYAKIEAKSRKTDPFMALVASMCIEDELKGCVKAQKPRLKAIAL